MNLARSNNMKIIDNPASDPEWPNVGRSDHDFRSEWGGLYVHLYTVIHPRNTETETRLLVENCCAEIAQGLIADRAAFSDDDRFQIVVGWPEEIRTSGRQIVKTGGDWDEIERLSNGNLPLKFYPSWSRGICEVGEDS